MLGIFKISCYLLVISILLLFSIFNICVSVIFVKTLIKKLKNEKQR